MPDLQTSLFWIVAGLTGLSAVMVVVTQNIVRAAAWLLFALAGTAGLFFLLSADFVGATQLIVYVGGTMVLVVFGVMLTAQGPFINMKTGVAEWAIAALVGLAFLAVLVVSFATTPQVPMVAVEPRTPGESMNAVALGQTFLGVTDATPKANLTGLPKDKAIERTRMSYFFPFEIVSVHLLVVLIAAAYLARAKRRRGVNP